MSGAGISEYYDEYCLKGGSGGKIGGKSGPPPIIPCRKPEDVEPVGGRAQARARAAAKAYAANTIGLPIQDSDFVATVYGESDRGTHRIQPQWTKSTDPNWVPSHRIDSSTLYEPADRDPPNRNQFHVYKSTLIDPLDTPSVPLSVPDVHKLRYMHNTYMCPDDWY